MKNEKTKHMETFTLRQRAEGRLNKNITGKTAPNTEAGTLRLIHELEVHRIELEMQNEELIMARDKAESAIEKFTWLYDFAPVGYFTVDRIGTLSELNLTCATMLGKERSALIGKSFGNFVNRDNLSAFNNFIQQLFETNSKQVCELRLTNSDKLSICVLLEGIVSEDDQNCHITAINITNRKETETALKESEVHLRELNATKDKLFSIISHDLRSPFSSIIGFSKIILEHIRIKDYEGIEEYAGIIHDSSWRVMNLLTNLLEWSSSHTGRMEYNPEYIDIVELIRESATMSYAAAQQKTITISNDLPHNLTVFADKIMIGTVLRNLISNAIKFTHTNGKIVISAKKELNGIIISVSDNGVGIAKQDLEKLFRIEENSSTLGTQDERGTGLGLLLSREFILKHGGKIWVESELGKGSTFHFRLPNN